MDDSLYAPDAPLDAYLSIAERLYHEDRLDAAMQVVEDAFQSKGWPPGLWTAFYNELVCEKDARDASVITPAGEGLSIELSREASVTMRESISSAAKDARDAIARVLNVEYGRPALLTIFLPGALVDFIVGSYGYVSHKVDLDKICLPWDTAQSPAELPEALLHEFAHVAQRALAGEERPHWLDEGLAVYLSKELDRPGMRSELRAAYLNKKLLSTRALEAALSSGDLRKDDPRQVNDAYVLAGTLVRRWTERYGLESVREALALIGQGRSPGKAVHEATGTSLKRIEAEWRKDLSR